MGFGHRPIVHQSLDYSILNIVYIFTEFWCLVQSIIKSRVLKSFTVIVDLLISPFSSVSFA